MAFKVVITDCTWEDISVERGILEQGGAEVTRAQCSRPEEVLAAGAGADALLVGWAPITKEVVAGLKRCRLLMRYGTGYNNIDVEAATAAGIAVAINAEYCIEEVATHTLALLLACHRQIGVLTHSVRTGVWDPLAVMGPMPPLSKQTVGIVGLGRIGRRFAAMAGPLVNRILVFDPPLEADKARFPGLEFVSLDRLLAESDYVSLHVPLGADTRHLIAKEALMKMRPTAYLINCARGPVVDEEALVEALQQKRLAGAALDVFSLEPLPMDHPLRSFPSVILTPHAASCSEQANYLIRAYPAHTIVKFFRGEPVSLLNNPSRRALA